MESLRGCAENKSHGDEIEGETVYSGLLKNVAVTNLAIVAVPQPGVATRTNPPPTLRWLVQGALKIVRPNVKAVAVFAGTLSLFHDSAILTARIAVRNSCLNL
jgi:hypothetical protein